MVCKKCGVDITDLVYYPGETVIFEPIDGKGGIVEPYCKECVVKVVMEVY